MRRLSTFIFGMAAGGLLIYAALNYHLIHASTGLHLVPKARATLAETYVDVRGFTPADWARHADVAVALFQADRTDLMQSAANESLWNGIDRILPSPAQSE